MHAEGRKNYFPIQFQLGNARVKSWNTFIHLQLETEAVRYAVRISHPHWKFKVGVLMKKKNQLEQLAHVAFKHFRKFGWGLVDYILIKKRFDNSDHISRKMKYRVLLNKIESFLTPLEMKSIWAESFFLYCAVHIYFSMMI